MEQLQQMFTEQSVAVSGQRRVATESIKLTRLIEEDEIESYLTTFERNYGCPRGRQGMLVLSSSPAAYWEGAAGLYGSPTAGQQATGDQQQLNYTSKNSRPHTRVS